MKTMARHKLTIRAVKVIVEASRGGGGTHENINTGGHHPTPCHYCLWKWHKAAAVLSNYLPLGSSPAQHPFLLLNPNLT